MSGDMFVYQNWWVGARDAVKTSTTHRTSPTAKIYLAPSGKSAMAEKPCFVSIHIYNPHNDPTVSIFIISILQINKGNFSVPSYP